MKRLMIVLLVGLFIPSIVLARDVSTMTLRGYIIDNQCASTQTDAQMDEFVKVHTKECALTDACVKSGYSIYANHHIYKFDQVSGDMIAEFLRQPSATLLVVAVVRKGVNEVRLLSIKNAD